MQNSVLKPLGRPSVIFTVLLSLAALTSCEGTPQETHPLTRPHYPSGLAISGNTLTVLSMNYDRRFTTGALLTVDLDKVDSKLAQLADDSVPAASRFVSGEDVVTSSAFVDAFSRQALVVSTGASTQSAVIFQNRDQETLQAVTLKAGQVQCSAASARAAASGSASALGQNCLKSTGVFKLPSREPYTMAALPTDPAKPGFPQIVVGYLGSDQIDVVEQDPDTGYPTRVVTSTNLLPLVNKTKLQAHVGAQVPRAHVRSVKVLAKGQGSYAGESLVFVAMEFGLSVDTSFIDPKGARIVWFPITKLLDGSLSNSDLGEWDLTTQINAKGVSDLEVVVEGGVARLYALLTRTDAIVRADLKTAPGTSTLTTAILRRILDTCDSPQQIAYVASTKKLIMGCYDGTAQASIRLLDPDDLEPTHIVNRFGRGMGAFTFDDKRTKKRVYVSYGTDGTVGVLSLDTLETQGHIFLASPRNLPGGQ